jgi:mono/diheme cytochrome c family protein
MLDLIGSGLLLLALATATIATLAPASGASVASSSPPPDPTVERGQMLFFAKGCVGCHRIFSVNPTGPLIGPELTSLEVAAATRRPGMSAEEYVRESIRTPGAFIAANATTTMPDLGLSDAEIEALTAFLLAPDAE